MGFSDPSPKVTRGYGLKDEVLDEMILKENIVDSSKKFDKLFEQIRYRFRSSDRIRLLEFNEKTGTCYETRKLFQALILGNYKIFYSSNHSNKDCCVILKYQRLKLGKEFKDHTLPHEYAHHYQFASAGFPAYFSKATPKEQHIQFAKTIQIGPAKGSILIDKSYFTDNVELVIKDFSERIADFICEEIIWEKGFKDGIIEEFLSDKRQDPAITMPSIVKTQNPKIVTYARRLGIFDIAVWDAKLSKRFKNNPELQRMLRKEKRRVIKLNKKLDKPKSKLTSIRDMILRTNYKSFKQINKTIGFIKNTMNSLSIEIQSDETW